MATKKDLVEAYTFSRRRLVTAFVSGAPGGREVEPARPGRVIVGGVALAVLLVAGAAVAGVLKPRPDADWRNSGLVTDDRGALYVILDEEIGGQPTLRSVINVTSAQLILGHDRKAKAVPADVIAGEPKGPPIGILGAPATVPGSSQLVGSGWTSCTGTGLGIRTDVHHRSLVAPATQEGFVVQGRPSKQRYLIAEASSADLPDRAYAYPVPRRDDDDLYTALGVSAVDVVDVPDRWIELFPKGGPLDQRGLGAAGWGQRLPAGVPGAAEGALVGDWTDSSGTQLMLTREGPVPLTEFAFAVLQKTPLARDRMPQEVSGVTGTQAGRTYDDAYWPASRLAGSPLAHEQLCAVLETAEDSEPAVRLGVDPTGSAAARDVPPRTREVSVESGYGAVVRSAGWGTDAGGTPHLLDDRGIAYVVAGPEEIDQLGYGSVPSLVVPDVWVKLFGAGPELSILAALCPPRAAEATTAAPTCS